MNFTLLLEHPYVSSYVLAITLFTLTLYGLDKYFALLNYSRVRERTLLLLALLGGFVGAWLGVFFFRHKTRKNVFLILLGAITLVDVAIAWLLYNYGNH